MRQRPRHSNGVRITDTMLIVMAAILAAPPGQPAWGWSLHASTGLGISTVYSTLDRLLRAGWITDCWEEPIPEGRPRRRLYQPAYNPNWHEQRLGGKP